ncbi:unnamed protein product [Paramecium sonneborni]|uniref:Protein kinase domain-containing protein n=1 Tax=Paramecium sonneborni TaxID=65129 RepID=A0A8S1PP73_9CILI|nr:unnamed protein product [Paramecium sonneborni]
MQEEDQENTVIDGWVIDTSALLGNGTYGKVLRCHHQNQPDIIHCIKIIPKMNIYVRDKDLKKIIENEKSIVSKLANVKCENLVQVIQVIDKPRCVYIIMELCDHDLQKEFDSIKPNWFSRIEQLDMIQQIINGACILKENQIIHRDIKPQNILVKMVRDRNGSQKKIYKVADFGFSRTLENMYQNANLTLVGSWKYLAPEIYYKKQFSAMCDIYSYGLLFHQIVFEGNLPFEEGEDQVRHYQRIEKFDFKCQQLPGQYGQLITNLIEKMIVFSQENRINFEDLRQHEISTNQFKIPQESLFLPLNIKLNKDDIQNQQLKNLETKFNRIYKLLNIYHRKYLLCEHVRNHLQTKFSSLDAYILVTQLFIRWIGFIQIKYAFSLIKMIPTNMEETLIQNNDIQLLLNILQRYQEHSQETNKYGQLNQTLTQIYYQFKIQLNLEYCEFLKTLYSNSDNNQQINLEQQSIILRKLDVQNFDCQFLCDELEKIINIQPLKEIYDQTGKQS